MLAGMGRHGKIFKRQDLEVRATEKTRVLDQKAADTHTGNGIFPRATADVSDTLMSNDEEDRVHMAGEHEGRDRAC